VAIQSSAPEVLSAVAEANDPRGTAFQFILPYA
jgi:hypothetical protein